MKPDVVLEGGNVARDSLGAVTISSLSLLTTSHRPAERSFHHKLRHQRGDRSCVPAGSAGDGSISWPLARDGSRVDCPFRGVDRCNESHVLARRSQSIQRRLPELVRRCGFGVPDLERALWSVANSLTMVVEETLVPFKRRESGNVVSREMHIHNLPWPQEALEVLGETPVEMRVTLSYFIEPNPSRRGVTSRYRYESHGLRFDVKRPLETIDGFRGRISAAARDDKYDSGGSGSDPSWRIGTQGRHRGSIHGDIWCGSAADLASRGFIAVYPTSGWWKTRPTLQHYDRAVRYSLVVSIRAPEVDVDLYAEVANQIDVALPIEI